MTAQRTRRICVLTGGGDAPGLNAVLFGLVMRAAHHGIEVIGSEDGFDGLITGRTMLLDEPRVRGIASRGGSIIGCSNRANPFAYPVRLPSGEIETRDESARVIEELQRLGADMLVALGGDGTMFMTDRLGQLGVRTIGVPKTIDNDLAATDVTFGFQSAVECATWAVDRLHSTAAAHDRVMIVEVMGRYAGWIAIESGLAGGAHVILLPEIPYDVERVAQKIHERTQMGLTYSVVVVSEGAKPVGGEVAVLEHMPKGHLPRLGGAGERLQRALEPLIREHEIRVTVLGHLQRGGSPTPFDRNLGMRFGVAAADLAARGAAGRMVSLRNGSVVDVPISEAVGRNRFVPPDGELCQTARAVGIELGG
jgi:6-phosphofructokinase 1